jgi:hypothetical protein
MTYSLPSTNKLAIIGDLHQHSIQANCHQSISNYNRIPVGTGESQEILRVPREMSAGRTDEGPIFCRSHAAMVAGSNRTEPPTLNEGIRFSAASL